MSQLALNLAPRLRYLPESFIRHSGVAQLLTDVTSIIQVPGYRALLIEGPPRSGKTHLAFTLASDLTAAGRYPKVVSGAEAAEFFATKTSYDPAEVLILDDCHRYFVEASDSGAFVNQSELARRAGAALVLFSSFPLTELACDEHVASRLRSGTGYLIGPPSDAEMLDLLESMARQRGIGLTDYKLTYLTKRIGRDIPGIERYLEKLQILARVRGEPLRLDVLADAV